MNSDSEEEFRKEREEIRFSETESESEKEEQVFDINSDSEDEGMLEQFKLHNRTHLVEQEESEESEESEENWGTKDDYYLNEEEDSDNSEEEKEALKIQQKQLQDLNEDDFMSNVKFKPKINQKQKNKTIAFYKNEVKKYEGIQNQLVSLYLLNISFYFAVESTIDCSNHPVLTTLEELRALLQKYEKYGFDKLDDKNNLKNNQGISDTESIGAEEIESRMLEQTECESINSIDDEDIIDINNSNSISKELLPSMNEQDSDQERYSIEDESSAEKLSEIGGLPIEEYVPIKPKKNSKKQDTFGEFENIDLDLDDKRRRKISLRFHANRVEKSLLKNDLSKKAYSKDTDSVVEPKNKEKKNVVDEKDQDLVDFYKENGVVDDFDPSEEDPNNQNSDKEYYNSIKAQTEAAKREKKQLRQEAHDLLLEPMELEEELEEVDKRKATYKILANRGLTPYRKKENRNPRVKKKIKYQNALKKIGSVKRLVVDKSKVGKYHGEVTGIKANLARSVRF